MARNEQDERNRQQSYSPNTRDFDREYNPQGSRPRGDFENQYSGNADRWTGYDEGPQHWREGRERGGRGYERDDRNREGGPGMTGRGDRGSFSADQGHLSLIHI